MKLNLDAYLPIYRAWIASGRHWIIADLFALECLEVLDSCGWDASTDQGKVVLAALEGLIGSNLQQPAIDTYPAGPVTHARQAALLAWKAGSDHPLAAPPEAPAK